MISRDRLFSRTYLRFRFAVFRRLFVFSDLAPLFRFAAILPLSLIAEAPSRGRRSEAQPDFSPLSEKQ
jgi:hypothetical protein